jgi:uncharacterized protein (DUF885 family)
MMKRWLITLVLALGAPAFAQADTDAQETAALQALFEREWEALAQRYPEDSSTRGDLRFNDRLEDASDQARDAFDARERQWLAEARAIRRERLSPTDRVSLDLFIANQQRRVERQAFRGLRSLAVGALGGAQTEFADLLRQLPMDNERQAQQLLRRMALYPHKVDQQIESMRAGIVLGWVGARPVLERALAQIDAQLPADPQAGPFFAPFKRMGSAMAPAQQQRLREAALAAIVRDVVPAMRKLRAFIADEYLPRAPQSGAMGSYPDGARVYEMLVRHRTTTALTPPADPRHRPA